MMAAVLLMDIHTLLDLHLGLSRASISTYVFRVECFIQPQFRLWRTGGAYARSDRAIMLSSSLLTIDPFLMLHPYDSLPLCPLFLN